MNKDKKHLTWAEACELAEQISVDHEKQWKDYLRKEFEGLNNSSSTPSPVPIAWEKEFVKMFCSEETGKYDGKSFRLCARDSYAADNLKAFIARQIEAAGAKKGESNRKAYQLGYREARAALIQEIKHRFENEAFYMSHRDLLMFLDSLDNKSTQ